MIRVRLCQKLNFEPMEAYVILLKCGSLELLYNLFYAIDGNVKSDVFAIRTKLKVQ